MDGDQVTRLIDDGTRQAVQEQVGQWEAGELAEFLERRPESQDCYLTGSRRPVERVYTPADVADVPFEDIGLPGRYPFTRGPYPTMYRGRVWTMRQIAGFGTPDETNQRFRYLISQGQTGLSVDFDMPTLMGYDSDHPASRGEVGREGVAVDLLEDMDRLFDGIDLENISVSMTINPSAWILLAMYIAVAQDRGPGSQQALRDDSKRHPQGVHRPKGVDLPPRAQHEDRAGHDHLHRAAGWRGTTRSTSVATTSRRRGRVPDRRPPSRWRRPGSMCGRSWTRACPWTSSPPDSRSTSSPRRTSSRRSPSFGRSGASMPA